MGIAIYNASYNLQDLPSVSSCLSYVDEKVKKVSQLFYDYIVYPIGIGALFGVLDFALCAIPITLDKIFSLAGIELLEGFEDGEFDFVEAVLASSLVPLIEEFIFRVVIQGSVKWVAANVLPNQEIDILGYVKLSLPALVSIVVTSILFGVLHYPNAGVLAVLSAAILWPR